MLFNLFAEGPAGSSSKLMCFLI